MADNEANPKPKSSKSPFVLLLVLINLLAVGVFGFLLLGRRQEAPVASPASAAAALPANRMGPTVKIADFVVLLRDVERERYARVSFEIEVASEADRTALAEHLPRLRDVFIAYLADRSADEMRGSQGLSRIKAELKEQLKDRLPGIAVRELYVTDLVVQ